MRRRGRYSTSAYRKKNTIICTYGLPYFPSLSTRSYVGRRLLPRPTEVHALRRLHSIRRYGYERVGTGCYGRIRFTDAPPRRNGSHPYLSTCTRVVVVVAVVVVVVRVTTRVQALFARRGAAEESVSKESCLSKPPNKSSFCAMTYPLRGLPFHSPAFPVERVLARTCRCRRFMTSRHVDELGNSRGRRNFDQHRRVWHPGISTPPTCPALARLGTPHAGR